MLAYKRVLYFIALKTTRVDEKSVAFESYQGRSFSCNPKGMYMAMKDSDEFLEFHFVWAFRNPQKYKHLEDERTKIVKTESFSYFRALSGAKYWVFNSNTRSFLKPSNKQVFAQTWHGTPLKKIGCDVQYEASALTNLCDIRKNYIREGKKLSLMISPSKYCTEKLVSAFGLEKLGKKNIVLETGYPRNDRLFSYTGEEYKNLREQYGIPKGKKAILYAPTFRDNRHSLTKGYDTGIGLDFKKMEKLLGQEYVLLLRAHYFVSEHICDAGQNGFVIDVSKVDDVNDLYIISDILVTDYSSVFFDYANLKRPIFFYMYDYDEYKNKVRDLYIDLSELPGPLVDSEEQLAEEIKNAADFRPDKKYEEFNKKYNYLDGKDCGLKAARAMAKYSPL